MCLCFIESNLFGRKDTPSNKKNQIFAPFLEIEHHLSLSKRDIEMMKKNKISFDADIILPLYNIL